jgi:hypothetical protein
VTSLSMESTNVTQFMLYLVSYLSNENGLMVPYCSVRLATQYLFHIQSTSNYEYTLKSTKKKYSLMPHDTHFKICLKLIGHVIFFDVSSNSNLRKM